MPGAPCHKVPARFPRGANFSVGIVLGSPFTSASPVDVSSICSPSVNTPRTFPQNQIAVGAVIVERDDRSDRSR